MICSASARACIDCGKCMFISSPFENEPERNIRAIFQQSPSFMLHTIEIRVERLTISVVHTKHSFLG